MASSPALRVVPGGRDRLRLCVVVGLDGADAGRTLLPWCASLAGVADVEVVAVHALEARTYPPEFRRDLPKAADRDQGSWRDEIRARIDAEWCGAVHVPGVSRRVIVGDGRPHSILARAAQRYEADLVVVGDRPRGALAEVFRPGVARRLRGLAPCPVVTIAARDDGTPPPSLERILVASDGRPSAVAAVGWAAGLAAGVGAELVVARVISAGAAPPTAPGAERRPRVVDDVSALLEAELAGAGHRLPERRRTAVLVGDPAAMLLALAESEAAGLVVLGAGVRSRLRPAAGSVAATLIRGAPCPVVTLAGPGPRIDTGIRPFRRTTDMTSETNRPRGVRFAAGTVVSPGEYRNCDTGKVRYFDGATPLPGGVNSASWQQVSDHFHASEDPGGTREPRRDAGPHAVRFAAGTVVSPGEYRNSDTGTVRYFDGTTPLPGGVNSASWQQVSDHFHPAQTAIQPEQRHTMPDTTSRPVRFAAGTLVSPGEYRNCETGAIRYFDGTTPLPGGINAASWQQVSDHYHPQVPGHS
ncbi:MAG TPA: universal stress protein [Candidatus Dormibacteraeota bacterium]|nr:universal stress protein [Candidatus Dormibacteraeota bacterium]